MPTWNKEEADYNSITVQCFRGSEFIKSYHISIDFKVTWQSSLFHLDTGNNKSQTFYIPAHLLSYFNKIIIVSDKRKNVNMEWE